MELSRLSKPAHQWREKTCLTGLKPWIALVVMRGKLVGSPDVAPQICILNSVFHRWIKTKKCPEKWRNVMSWCMEVTSAALAQVKIHFRQHPDNVASRSWSQSSSLLQSRLSTRGQTRAKPSLQASYRPRTELHLFTRGVPLLHVNMNYMNMLRSDWSRFSGSWKTKRQ